MEHGSSPGFEEDDKFTQNGEALQKDPVAEVLFSGIDHVVHRCLRVNEEGLPVALEQGQTIELANGHASGGKAASCEFAALVSRKLNGGYIYDSAVALSSDTDESPQELHITIYASPCSYEARISQCYNGSPEEEKHTQSWRFDDEEQAKQFVTDWIEPNAKPGETE